MIVTDEKLLRVKCENVLPLELGYILSQLERELYESGNIGKPGLGLAAPQIGIAKRAAIIRTEKISIDLINCRIEKGYDEKLFEGEGCLSFPGKYVNTMRYREIYVVENMVWPHSFIATDLLAVVIGHELNHWDSVLLSDLEIK